MQTFTTEEWNQLSYFFWSLSMDASMARNPVAARVFSETMRECNRQHAISLGLRRIG